MVQKNVVSVVCYLLYNVIEVAVSSKVTYVVDKHQTFAGVTALVIEKKSGLSTEDHGKAMPRMSLYIFITLQVCEERPVP